MIDWRDRLMNAAKADMANEQAAWPFRRETLRERLVREMERGDLHQIENPMNARCRKRRQS